MYPEPAARRYAEAAYLIAREAKKEDAWRAGLQSIAALFGNPDAERVFASSRASAEDKRQLVEKSLEGLDPEVLNLARLLLRRGRTMLGPQISQAYEEILDRANAISDQAGAVSFVDPDVRPGEQYAYRARGVINGQEVISTAVSVTVPWLTLGLEPVRPNPLAGADLTVAFVLPVQMYVRIVVLDIQGRVRATLARGWQDAGRHEVRWSAGEHLGTGMYFVQMDAGERKITQRLTVVR